MTHTPDANPIATSGPFNQWWQRITSTIPTTLTNYVSPTRLLGANQLFVWNELLNDVGRRRVYQVIALVLLAEALAVTIPLGLGQIMEGLTSQDLITFLIGIALYGVLDHALHITHYYLVGRRERMFQSHFVSMPAFLSRLYTNLSLSQIVSNESAIDGGGVESFHSKAEQVRDAYVGNFIPNFANIGFGIVVCFVVSPAIGFGVLAYVVFDRLWSRRQTQSLMELTYPIEEEFRRWYRFVRERWENVSVIKWNGTERRFIRELIARVQPTLEKDDYAWRVVHAFRILQRRLAATYAMLAVLAWLGFSIFTGSAESVNVSNFVWLLLVLQQIFTRLRDMTEGEQQIQRNDVRMTGYREALQVAPDFPVDVGMPFTDDHIGLRLEDVTLVHGKGGEAKTVLKDVNLTIAPGERVAIVGESGAGKSQLTDVIMRSVDVTQGTVYVNERPLRELAHDTYTRRIGHIPQDMEVFEGTVRENVLECLSHFDIDARPYTDEFVWSVINRAGLDLSGRLDHGLDTKVGYRGLKLSGGQRQRLAIAAALAKDPYLIIGDEMTSDLDSRSEAHVLKELSETLPERTTEIMIAHRLSTLGTPDKVVYVEPCTATTMTTNVRVYQSLRELYEAEPEFRALADAQGFTPVA